MTDEHLDLKILMTWLLIIEHRKVGTRDTLPITAIKIDRNRDQLIEDFDNFFPQVSGLVNSLIPKLLAK